MNFKKGFYYKKYFYVWHKKELYQLPKICKYCKGLRKLNLIQIGSKKGYRVSGDKKTIEQLLLITTDINKKVELVKHEDCPF